MNVKKIISSILLENGMTSGGADSAFGAGVQSTETQFSGDNYAKNDNRMPKSIFGGVLTRKKLIKPKRKKNKKRRSK
jgi:hypothetical protein